MLVVVFNPLPYPRRDVIEAWINMPDARPRNETWRAYRPPEGLQVLDAGGTPVSTQNQGYTAESYCVCELHTRAFPYNCLRHRIFFDTGEVPAGGYKVFRAATIDSECLAGGRQLGHAKIIGPAHHSMALDPHSLTIHSCVSRCRLRKSQLITFSTRSTGT